MKSFVTALMLLAFLMGIGYTTSGHSSKKYPGHPWEEWYKSPNLSPDKNLVDPWEDNF
jgi:hypothetical protein